MPRFARPWCNKRLRAPAAKGGEEVFSCCCTNRILIPLPAALPLEFPAPHEAPRPAGQPEGKDGDGAGPSPQRPPAPTPEGVFREHAPRIYRLALRMVGNEADAEDVTAEVLLKVVRKLGTFRGEASVASWLYRITANAVFALRRKRATQRERQLASDEWQSVEGGPRPGLARWPARPDQQAARRELARAIEAAVAGLRPMYRAVYVLADVEGLANADIGGRLGLSLPAVKSRLHRARLMMRQALAGRLPM